VDADDFAAILMSEARREWQDPVAIGERIGIKKGMTVADLGCGPGFFTLPIASMVGEKGKVYSVDSSPAMIKHLRENVSRLGPEKHAVKVVMADVSKTGIPTRSVDVALFANILHDIEDKKAFLAEVARICSPGATVADIDWKKVPTEAGPPLEIRLSERESREILFDGGLSVVRKIEAGPYHYGLVCEFE
jgi:ubiquinone/menaquinone biosynthesis C-methylase UbiE